MIQASVLFTTVKIFPIMPQKQFGKYLRFWKVNRKWKPWSLRKDKKSSFYPFPRKESFFRFKKNRQLELRQYKNGFAYVKNMIVLKLSQFCPRLHGKGKSAAISKQTCCFSQKRIRTYIVLALIQIMPKKHLAHWSKIDLWEFNAIKRS